MNKLTGVAKSEQHRLNISNARKALGLKPSKECSQKGNAASISIRVERARAKGFPNLNQTGRIRTDASRLKMRLAKLGKPGNHTQKHTDEAKEKISAKVVAAYARGAIKFPSKNTSIELAIQAVLTSLGIDFIPQHCLISRYAVDIFVPSRNLVIECDGSYWHSRPGIAERDARKDSQLKAAGYTVLRLPEKEIKSGQSAEQLTRLFG